MHSLTELVRNFTQWASSADQSEDGWQSDFPAWNEMINLACSAMLEGGDESQFGLIEFCWHMSEETEDMQDYAKDHIHSCQLIVKKLARSTEPSVRWQAYSAIGILGEDADSTLRLGIMDDDPYCMRRAILALAEIEPPDSSELRVRFMNHEDPLIRQAAKEFKS